MVPSIMAASVFLPLFGPPLRVLYCVPGTGGVRVNVNYCAFPS